MKKLTIITTLMFAGVAPFLWGSEGERYTFKQDTSIPNLYTAAYKRGEITVITKKEEHEGDDYLIVRYAHGKHGAKLEQICLEFKDYFTTMCSWSKVDSVAYSKYRSTEYGQRFVYRSMPRNKIDFLWKVADEFKRQQRRNGDVFEDEEEE